LHAAELPRWLGRSSMATTFNNALTWLNLVIDWFMPAVGTEDREQAKQMRMFLISHLLGPFIGNSVPIALYMFDPNPGYDVAVLAASITGFWIFPFVLRAFGHYYLLAILSIQNLAFCILWSCYFYGGITSPTLPWVLTIPLLAFFYVGSAPMLRLVVLGMFTANFGIFYGMSVVYGLPEHGMPFASLQGLGLVSTAAASLYVAMMAFFYAKVLASQGELESEMREHLATANKLRQATVEAEQAGAAKADFLAKMSHELRTPLNAVIGYSQILLEDEEDGGDPETIADLNRIHSAGRHLLKLVNEVLDLIKIDAGKMTLYREKVDLAGLIGEIVNDVRNNNKQNTSEIVAMCSDDLDDLFTDRSRLHDATFEIVENAVKFTKNGRIDIEAYRQKDGFGAGEDGLVIRIKDSGAGIPAEHLPTLFEQFSMFNDASASKYGGTGLGLALTQRLCRLLGGDIAVESKENEGSCFTITIPIVVKDEDAAGADAASNATLTSDAEIAEVEDAISLLKAAVHDSKNEDAQTMKVASHA
jgi:signal transduction histidine kinase